jgi:hypothetical protein
MESNMTTVIDINFITAVSNKFPGEENKAMHRDCISVVHSKTKASSKQY